MEAEGMGTHLVGVEDLAVIRNLETAFEEETRTSGAYRAFATRADEEGFHGIGSLFRAIARAEQIHASNHARVLRHMGGSTTFEAAPPRIESTLENLRAVLVDQKFEVDYLYPTFLTNAVPLFDSTAIRTFHWALEADKSHVRLCTNATTEVIAGDKSSWAYSPHDYAVCALCGYAVGNPDGENCPGCNYLWEKFETVR
jgi:rubrerythrin